MKKFTHVSLRRRPCFAGAKEEQEEEEEIEIKNRFTVTQSIFTDFTNNVTGVEPHALSHMYRKWSNNNRAGQWEEENWLCGRAHMASRPDVVSDLSIQTDPTLPLRAPTQMSISKQTHTPVSYTHLSGLKVLLPPENPRHTRIVVWKEVLNNCDSNNRNRR